MGTLLGLLAALLLTLATGWFVAAEFAYVAARRGVLEEQAATGDRGSARAVRLMRRLSFVLSGAQLGITVTTLALGYIAEPAIGGALEPLLGDRAGLITVLAFVIATAASMVFGELAPKNLAIARPEPLARGLSRGVSVYMAIFGPLIRLFDVAAVKLLKLVGVEAAEELRSGVTADELDLIVEESRQAGELDAAQARLLSRALGFPDLVAGEVMIPRPAVVSVPITATGADLLDLLRTPYTRYPVVGEAGDLDEVVGVVHVEDLLNHPPAERATVPVADMLREPLLVPESMLATEVVRRLRASGSQMAVVLDEYGGTAGILTAEDLVEELVGDIVDEHDTEALLAVPDGESAWTVPGRLRIDELERETEVDLPEGEYETVAGFVLDRLGRIPSPGDEVVVGDVVVRVLDLRGRQITSLRVERLPASDEPAGGDEP